MRLKEEALQSFIGKAQDRAEKQDTLMGWRCSPGGIFVSPSGFGYCITFDPEREVVKLWQSKNKSFDINHNGSSQLDENSAKASYLIYETRIEYLNTKRLSEVMKKHDERAMDRAGHYRFLCVAFSTNYSGKKAHDPNKVHYGQNLMINAKGYNAVLYDETVGGALSVIRSIYRHEDHFVRIHLNLNTVKNGFSVLINDVKYDKNSDDPLRGADEIRRETSENTWEQRSLYADQGMKYNLTAHFAQPFNYVHRIDLKAKLATVVIGSGLFAADPHFGFWGLIGSIGYAAFHEELHRATEHFIDVSRIFMHRVGVMDITHKKGRVSEDALSNIEKYIREDDLISGKNSQKLFPKATGKSCRGERNVMMTNRVVQDVSRRLAAREIPYNDGVNSLKLFLSQIYQLNIPGRIYPLDERTDAFEFDNGVCGVRYDNWEMGEFRIIAAFNGNLVKNEALLLPEVFRKKLQERQIVSFDAKIEGGWLKILGAENNLTSERAVEKAKEKLFSQQDFMPHKVRRRSEICVNEVFGHEEGSPYEDFYPSSINENRRVWEGVRTFPAGEATMKYHEFIQSNAYYLENA